MRRSSFIWAAFAFITTAYAQDPDFDTSVDQYSDVSFRLANDKTNGFSVEYHNWYKIVTNHELNEQYALVCCGQPTTNFTQYHAAVNTPVTNVGVTTIRDLLPYMELLGSGERVKSIEGYQNVTSPCYSGVTDSPGNGTVDIIFSDHSLANMPGSTSYVGFSPDTEQLTPLQQASWLVYIALFFDEEGEATTTFGNIESSYTCHKDNMADAPEKKNLAWTYYDSTNKTWTLVNTPFYKSLAEDAGAKLVEPNSAQSTSYTQLNEFHTAIRYADYVIDVTPINNLGNQSYDDWLTLGGFNNNFNVYSQAFVSEKNVFRTDGLVNTNGYSDWSQRSPARPDLALRDIIHMIYPTYQNEYSFTWLRNFAKSDTPRQVADISYVCNATDIRSELQCGPNKFGVDQNQSSGGGDVHSLSTGGKAGISVGVVVAAIIAGLAAFFFWRRHRQVKASRPFYRMNDVNQSNP